MRLAVIGYGSMGKRYVAMAHASKRWLDGVLVSDPALEVDIERGFGLHYSLADAIRLADAIVVAAPASTRAQMLPQVLAEGKPVLIEKPLALSADEVGHLTPTAPVLVGYNLRSLGPYRQFRQALIPEFLNPLRATFRIECDASTWPGRTYADALSECSHEIDAALWALGPADVTAAASRRSTQWTITLQHKTGVVSRIEIDTSATAYARGATVDNGTSVSWDAPNGLATFTSRDGVTRSFAWTPEMTYRRQFAHFTDLAESFGRGFHDYVTPRCSWEDGLATLRACDAARTIALTNR